MSTKFSGYAYQHTHMSTCPGMSGQPGQSPLMPPWCGRLAQSPRIAMQAAVGSQQPPTRTHPCR
ncbi:hypothetical protein CHLRE_09g398652v5 [Chlamydomonas reinhardtii]|uniref:Uncharacterized protein n=1 Tax=Chlamydomonas reinhardtii TaxID=3055 RepID=A0A2K3DD05_CHLRE|nr:uncharacterized protein CHLRE_09g398652v5 [Chlamydomonas reinhardtii]PNW78409.1 hypothetical protein CHLRE_09g398652v5 [Chlamydomonas reinhardtii]